MASSEIINEANELKYSVSKWNRFRSCQAYVSDVIDGRFQLIKSYKTIVGMVDHDNDKVYEFGKYSRTTSKQFTQIMGSMFRSYDREFIDECNY